MISNPQKTHLAKTHLGAELSELFKRPIARKRPNGASALAHGRTEGAIGRFGGVFLSSAQESAHYT